jgi:hypothetical protein
MGPGEVFQAFQGASRWIENCSQEAFRDRPLGQNKWPDKYSCQVCAAGSPGTLGGPGLGRQMASSPLDTVVEDAESRPVRADPAGRGCGTQAGNRIILHYYSFML